MDYKNITLEGSDGQTHSISQFKQPLILYFYPKDNTSSCSTQAEEYTALKDEFAQYNVKIVGVSRDSIKSHENFIKDKNLDILLLSDPNDELNNAFKVIGEKKVFGRIGYGVVRSSFILDGNGNILEEYRQVKAKGNASRMVDRVKELFKPIK